jgi:hypothetical protein
MTPRLLRSVNIELVAFWVLHPDRVVVEPFLGQVWKPADHMTGGNARICMMCGRVGLAPEDGRRERAYLLRDWSRCVDPAR